jgi:hypothetical protein
MDEEGQLVLISEEILEVREKRLRNRSIKEYMITWKDLPIEDATWEKEHVVREAGLELLEDKQFLVGETIMSPLPLDKEVMRRLSGLGIPTRPQSHTKGEGQVD